ncbi:bacteriorhodopsin [Actinomycetospora sp. CA-084318]|uniref:bacteriorhodopsin n=1 Tax=Actinomycetospora sp. CA-084318 TaxID=3239892 RepID=UPI003D967C3E
MALTVPGPVLAAATPQGEFAAEIAYSPGIWHLIEYSFVVAGFALAAGCVYSLMGRNEVATKYRAAVHGSALLQGVAALAYLALIITWNSGFDYVNGLYVPAATERFDGGLRYADWSVTVPLLAVELLAVCAIAGKALSRARAIAVVSAFGMIVTGFLGASVFDNGTSTLWLNVWAAISTVFFLVLYGVLGKAVADSRGALSAGTFTSLLRSTIVLFAIFGAYPLLYLVQVLVGPNSNLVAWAVVVQVGFSFSDIIAKVGFGVMIHRVAKLRTAEDLEAGTTTHDEPVWIAHELQAAPRPALAEALTGTGSVLTGAGAGNGVGNGRRGSHEAAGR